MNCRNDHAAPSCACPSCRPRYLWLLLIVPLAVALYLVLLRRRKKAAVRYGNFGMLKQAMGAGNRIRRHIPPALFLLALTLMILGIARPAAVMSVVVAQIDRHPRHGCLGQHARHRRQALARRGDAGRRQGVHRPAAQGRHHRHRRLCRQRLSGPVPRPPTAPASTPRSTASSCSAAPRWAPASSPRSRRCSPTKTFRSIPLQPAVIRSIRHSTASTNRGTPLGRGRSRRSRSSVEPGSDKSAVIILLTDGATNAGPGPDRGRAPGRQPRRARLSRSASARPSGDDRGLRRLAACVRSSMRSR